jgi:hypothetical protein
VGRIVGVHVLEASQLLLLLGGGRGRRQRPQLHLLIPSRLLYAVLDISQAPHMLPSRVADPDPGSSAFLTHGSGILDSG